MITRSPAVRLQAATAEKKPKEDRRSQSTRKVLLPAGNTSKRLCYRARRRRRVARQSSSDVLVKCRRKQQLAAQAACRRYGSCKCARLSNSFRIRRNEADSSSKRRKRLPLTPPYITTLFSTSASCVQIFSNICQNICVTFSELVTTYLTFYAVSCDSFSQ